MACFSSLTNHIAGPSAPGPRIAFSQLAKGESRVHRDLPSIKYIERGSEEFLVGGRWHRLTAGQVMIVAPGDAITAVVPREHTVGLCFFLDDAQIHVDGLPADGDLQWNGSFITSASGTRLGRFLQVFLRTATSAVPPLPSERYLLRAGHLLLEQWRSLADRRGFLESKRPSTRLELLQRLERARALIHSRVTDRPTLDELARAAAVSPFHLVRAFTAWYGTSPLDYHRRLRLLHARKLLLRTGSHVSEVAELVGYADHPAFTNAFRRQFGIPPSAVRR